LPPSDQSAFHREVAGRFGLVPHFFLSARDDPEIIEKLWGFAKSGYLDNPMPAVFKERLFVYLSRFCKVRYCIIRHRAFAGQPKAAGNICTEELVLLCEEMGIDTGVDSTR